MGSNNRSNVDPQTAIAELHEWYIPVFSHVSQFFSRKEKHPPYGPLSHIPAHVNTFNGDEIECTLNAVMRLTWWVMLELCSHFATIVATAYCLCNNLNLAYCNCIGAYANSNLSVPPTVRSIVHKELAENLPWCHVHAVSGCPRVGNNGV